MSTIFTHGHAVLIGVGADLPNTIDDAAGLADILKDPGRCAYPAGQVQLLTGEGAGRIHAWMRSAGRLLFSVALWCTAWKPSTIQTST